MRTYAFLMIGFLLVAALQMGCSVKQPPSTVPIAAPVPQSKEDILAVIQPVLEPLRTALHAGNGLNDATRQQVLTQLRDAVARFGDTNNGRSALRELGYQVGDIGKRAGDDKKWKLALACVDASEVLSMDSVLVGRLGDRAKKALEQPSLRVKGFLEDREKNDLYVFLDIVDRKTGEVQKIQAREGEEIKGFKILKVLGRNQKVHVEYLKIPGLIFDVDFEPNNP